MAIKGKKRSLGASNPSDVSINKKPERTSPKKLKTEKQTPVNTNGTAAKQSQKNNKPIEKKPKSQVETNNKVNGPTLAALIKRKEKKTEKRKQNRQKFGQYKPENIYATEEELQAKIANMSSMEKKSKTARRKLAVLKKKLKIKQGLYEPPVKPTPKVSETKKRAIRRQAAACSKNEGDAVKSKAIIAADAVKGVKTKKNIVEVKKNVKREPVEVKPEAEDDSEEDESDDEAEESMDASNVTEDANDSDENDEDDEEEEADSEEEDNEVVEKKVSQKGPKSAVDNAKSHQTVKKPEQPKQESGKKTRYVLFVGNLPYTATVDELKNHFLTKVSNVISVRIPTNAQTKEPRGFGYVEFDNSIDYEKGLSLHDSILSGRKINVQYSAGGSKTVNKRPEVAAKNQKLHALRKQGMLAGSVKNSNKRNARRNKSKPQ